MRMIAQEIAPGNETTFHHSMKRRCFMHDYKGRSIYLVTLEVAGRRRLLGRITTDSRLRGRHLTDAAPTAGQPLAERSTALSAGQPLAERSTAPSVGQPLDEPVIPLSVSGMGEAELKAVNAPLFEPSELGRRVVAEFMKISEHVPGVKPLLAQAMPDHFHGLLFVTREINRSLGSIMAGFKGKCSQLARELAPTEASGAMGSDRGNGSLWEPGYHDRILTGEGQLANMFRYVIDNPRRLALRLRYPDIFTSVKCLAGHGHQFEAYGNGFLLQRAAIAQVQCSRRFFGFKRLPKAHGKGLKVTREVAFETPEFAAKKTALFAAAKKGAVLCSPCISDGEKAIAYAAVDAGYPLIVLRREPFPPRFKPSGRFFDACANGQLLMLRPRELLPSISDERISRAECLALNAIVAEICGGRSEALTAEYLN